MCSMYIEDYIQKIICFWNWKENMSNCKPPTGLKTFSLKMHVIAGLEQNGKVLRKGINWAGSNGMQEALQNFSYEYLRFWIRNYETVRCKAFWVVNSSGKSSLRSLNLWNNCNHVVFGVFATAIVLFVLNLLKRTAPVAEMHS